jgi:hypothetical protein
MCHQGPTARLEGESSCFFTYLAIATRLAQLLGLHDLDKDPDSMPPGDDAGFPPGRSSLKRELSLRYVRRDYACTQPFNGRLQDMDVLGLL